MVVVLLFLILLCLLFPSLMRLAAMLLFFAFLYLVASMADKAHAWTDEDTRAEMYGPSYGLHLQHRHDGFRGWRDQNGFLHGNSENPNMRGTVYCWNNGVWICP